MITMDLISHDISLYRYTVTDVIEIHLLEPGWCFIQSPAPQGGKGWLKRSSERGNCNENKENSQCGSHSRQVAPADLFALDNGSAQVALDR